MITENDLHVLENYRMRLFDNIEQALKLDGHCKSYEGALQICLPNYFEWKADDHENLIALRLDCYVLGHARHHEWTGKTLTDCVLQADRELTKWREDMLEFNS